MLRSVTLPATKVYTPRLIWLQIRPEGPAEGVARVSAAPTGLIMLLRPSQGKPWAKFSRPVGPTADFKIVARSVENSPLRPPLRAFEHRCKSQQVWKGRAKLACPSGAKIGSTRVKTGVRGCVGSPGWSRSPLSAPTRPLSTHSQGG
jgi:hypothetical protein